MDEEEKSGSVLIRMFSNRNIQLGFTLLAIALILAFVAALPRQVSSTDNETFSEGGHIPLSQPYLPVNSSVTLTYNVEDGNSGSAEIWFERDGEEISIPDVEEYEIHLQDGESHTQDLIELEETPDEVHFEIPDQNGQIEFSHTIVQETRPYGLLAFPALLFLFIGMVYAYKGRSVIAAELKERKMREEAKKKAKEKTQKESIEVDDEGTENAEEDHKEIYPGPDDEPSDEGETEQKGGADHINFMGVQDTSEEDKD